MRKDMRTQTTLLSGLLLEHGISTAFMRPSQVVQFQTTGFYFDNVIKVSFGFLGMARFEAHSRWNKMSWIETR